MNTTLNDLNGLKVMEKILNGAYSVRHSKIE